MEETKNGLRATPLSIEEIYHGVQVHENRSVPLKINSSHCGLGSCTLQ